jgi:hypothetical protein
VRCFFLAAIDPQLRRGVTLRGYWTGGMGGGAPFARDPSKIWLPKTALKLSRYHSPNEQPSSIQGGVGALASSGSWGANSPFASWLML